MEESKNILISAEVDGQIRHLIGVGAGALVAHGWVAASFVEPITGVIMWGLIAAWSWYSKK